MDEKESEHAMSTNIAPIIVEETYKAPIMAVWRAITEKDRMRRWFFESMTDFKPQVGFETEFDVHAEGRVFPHQWKVTEVVPEKKIVYNWRYRGYPGNSFVTWELTKTPGGTRLTFTHTETERFPEDDPIFSRESCEAGWGYFLRDRLKAFLEKNE